MKLIRIYVGLLKGICHIRHKNPLVKIHRYNTNTYIRIKGLPRYWRGYIREPCDVCHLCFDFEVYFCQTI